MAVNKKYETPMLNELEKGEWPSFIKEIKMAAETNAMLNSFIFLHSPLSRMIFSAYEINALPFALHALRPATGHTGGRAGG